MRQFQVQDLALPPFSARRIAAGLLDACALAAAWQAFLRALIQGGALPLMQSLWLVMLGNAAWLYLRTLPFVYKLARSPQRSAEPLPPGAAGTILRKALLPEFRRALYPTLTAGTAALGFLLFGVGGGGKADPMMTTAVALSGLVLLAAASAFALAPLREAAPRSKADVFAAFAGAFARKWALIALVPAVSLPAIYLFGSDRGRGPGLQLALAESAALFIAALSAARAFHFAALAFFDPTPRRTPRNAAR